MKEIQTKPGLLALWLERITSDQEDTRRTN
jgi:hypothetical protein